MPHLEEQFPPVNPLLLQRPDALDPPDREEEETDRAGIVLQDAACFFLGPSTL